MAEIDESKEYMKLFASRKEGYYLYRPLKYEDIHPGSVGFFDDNNSWNEIADISNPEKLAAEGFSGLTPRLARSISNLRSDSCSWNTRSSETESERSYRGKAGASGAAGGVPVEGSGEMKYKTGSNGKAALVADGLVKMEHYPHPFGISIPEWARNNADALIEKSGKLAREHGLIAVQSVWITDSCAIKMSSGSNRDIDSALDVGATGLGKLGGGAAFIDKLSTEGWTTYKSEEGSKGRVVSFNGIKFKPRKFTKWFNSNPFKEVSVIEKCGDVSTTLPIMRPIFDEEENLVGFEEVKPVKNGACEWEFQKVPDSAKPQKDELKEVPEGEGFAVEVNDIECEGISEEEIEEEKRYQLAEKKKRDEEMLESWKALVAKLEAVNQKLRDSGEAQREREELQKAKDSQSEEVYTKIINVKPPAGK